MSKSDLLGTGTAFSNARRTGGRSERGRAKAIAQGDVPAYELVRVPLDQVSPTPLNPRRNFGTDEEMTRFGEELRQTQLSACVLVGRAAYLGLWPDHDARIGSASYVLINGERRFRSALHVGLESLDFVVRDDLAASRTDFIDHLLAENLEREDFDVIERARGVQQLVETCSEQGKEHGAKSRAAERLGKSPSWVTNQLVLLELPEEIQAMLSAGEIPERDGRALARAAKDRPDADAADLLGLLRETKEQESQVKAAQREILREAQEATTSAPIRPAGGAEASSAHFEPGTETGAEPTRLLSADKSPQPPAEAKAAPEEPQRPERLLSADKSPEPLSTPSGIAPEVGETPQTFVRGQKSEPTEASEKDPEQEPEGVIPPQARGAAADSVPWQDPQAMFDAIWSNMSAKNRAELTMLLIENNRANRAG
ncbi:ParB/RepB/Spo0J family partition protein [Streptomyces sp. NPDC056773]|uniref:ParB/RepB/Spo0J family partition protein n=1 Tax=unclassified Streptomyces TaxID=2593676 RepID=UPI003691F0D9